MKSVLKIFTILVLISLLGCELAFEDNRRVLIEGKLDVAQNIDPTRITIEAIASTSSNLFSGSDSELVAVGQPNNAGDFQLVSIVPTNASTVDLFVNCNLRTAASRGGLSSAKIRGIRLSESTNDKVTIPNIRIAALQPFNLRIRKEENTLQTIFVNFEFVQNPFTLNLNDQLDFIEDDFFNNFNEVRFDEGRNETTFRFTVLSNDRFVFSYRIQEEENIIEQNEITIDVSENSSFLFEF